MINSNEIIFFFLHVTLVWVKFGQSAISYLMWFFFFIFILFFGVGAFLTYDPSTSLIIISQSRIPGKWPHPSLKLVQLLLSIDS